MLAPQFAVDGPTDALGDRLDAGAELNRALNKHRNGEPINFGLGDAVRLLAHGMSRHRAISKAAAASVGQIRSSGNWCGISSPLHGGAE